MPEPPPTAPQQDLSVGDLAKHWRCSTKTIRRLITEGLPHQWVGKLVRFELPEVTNWRRARTKKLNDYLNLPIVEKIDIDQKPRAARLAGKPMMLTATQCVISFNPRDKVYRGCYRDPHTDTIKSKYIPRKACVKDEAEARAWLVQYETELHQEYLAEVLAAEAAKPKPVESLALLLPRWQKLLTDSRTNREGAPLARSTRAKWIGCINSYVLTHGIGKLPITNDLFDAFVVRDWVKWLKKQPISAYYVRDCVQALRTMISDCRNERWITLYANPAEDKIVRNEAPIGNPRSGKDNPIHLSAEQAIKLIESPLIPEQGKVLETGSIRKAFIQRIAILFALCTGCRMREVQGLAWKHVDLEQETVTIERQLVTAGDSRWLQVVEEPTFGPPKKESFRSLPLHSLLVKALTELKRRQNPKPNDPVFPHTLDRRSFAMHKYSPCSADAFRRELKAAGLSIKYEDRFPFTFHATRRTFMTLLSNADASETKISALAGHRQKGVSRHYIKLHIEQYRAVIQMLPFKDVKLDWLNETQHGVSEAAE